LRLAVLSPFVDKRHGTERALAEVLERLARDYHCEIHLYAQRVEDLSVTARAFSTRKDRSTGRSTKSGVIVWHRVPSLPGPHLAKFIFWILANTLRRIWDRLFHRLTFDLVLSPGINASDADVILVHSVFQRLQELSRANPAAKTENPRGLRTLHRRAYYALLSSLERRLYSNPRTALAAVSQRTADQLARYFHRAGVPVIPNGVDTVHFSFPARIALRRQARARRNLSDLDFVLLLIGNDWRVKGLPEVLAAMATDSLPSLHLIAAGTDAPDSFRELAAKLNIHNRCHFEIATPDVLDLYAAADVYVSPTHEDSFGLPVAEAMACGLPVITSAQAGVAALIRDGVDGFVLADPSDTAVLLQTIQRLRRDLAFRRQMGDAAALTAQRWTWDKCGDEVWKLLQQVAAQKNGLLR
jgi:UDP-glucose:(heptosyl)LPS alpha-1,3-glucosyltransferase